MELERYTRHHKHDLEVESCISIEGLGRGYLTLFADGSVWGWGSNEAGQLGLGDEDRRADPTRIDGLPPIVALAAGEAHALALSGDGGVWFWGWTADGQSGLGIPDRDEHESKVLLTPVRIPSLPPIVAIAAGGLHNLALDADGAVWVWGYNGLGALGLGREGTRRVSVPERVPWLPAIREVAALGAHSAAISEAGELWMWGWNVSGMLADGGTATRARPGVVPLPAAADRIALGTRHILARCIDGSLWG